jgi:ClpX C4-type zinc finger
VRPGERVLPTVPDARRQGLHSKTISTPVGTIGQVSEADRAERCSFCGKRRHRVAGLASTGHAQICNECTLLCDEIISEELG